MLISPSWHADSAGAVGAGTSTLHSASLLTCNYTGCEEGSLPITQPSYISLCESDFQCDLRACFYFYFSLSLSQQTPRPPRPRTSIVKKGFRRRAETLPPAAGFFLSEGSFGVKLATVDAGCLPVLFIQLVEELEWRCGAS